jgi:hypothetical protein
MGIMATTIAPHLRRNCYALFYIVHRVAGPLVLLGTILHWNRSILYLAGGLLYYVASSTPVWFEQYCRQRFQSRQGVRIVSVERIGATRTVVALTVEATPAAVQIHRPGQYVKVQAPELSWVTHPFPSIQSLPEIRQCRINCGFCSAASVPLPTRSRSS